MRKTILLTGSAVLALIVGLGVYLTESPTRPTANTGAEKKQETGSSALSVPSSVSRKSGVSTPSQQPSLGATSEPGPSAPASGTSRTGKSVAASVGAAPKHSEGGITGVPVTAKVTAANGAHDFSPNSLGKFPRVNIGLGDTVRVTVAYPESESGDLITIQSEDGGVIDGKQIVKQFRLDDARQLHFTFTSTMEGGVYRVTLRKGFDEKHLEFWGGPVSETQRSKS